MSSTEPRDKECINWSGPISPNGYGKLYFNGKNHNIHRLAWSLAHGRMPKRGYEICHHCDNRKCIEPSHLFEGTKSDNMKDASSKGRLFNPNTNKRFCIRGHEFDEKNTKIRPNGKRQCRKCMAMHQKIYRRKK